MPFTPNTPFGDQLALAVRQRGTPVMVGLDPRYHQLPLGLRRAQQATPDDQATAYQVFCQGVIDAVADLVSIVKPQAAFFEQLGPAGMIALKHVIDYAQQKGLLVVLDGKRNDIGTTATAYAQGYLGRGNSAWGADALTINPYLGVDSLSPFVEAANERGAGLFVLVKTSNPGGKTFQDLPCAGRPLYRHVAEHVERMARDTAGTSGYGIVAAVVGATYPEQIVELRAAMPHAWLLVPGYGSQGATSKDVAGAFDGQGLGAVVNSSRSLIFAHSIGRFAKEFGDKRWQDAVRAATSEMIDQLRADTPAGKLLAP